MDTRILPSRGSPPRRVSFPADRFIALGLGIAVYAGSIAFVGQGSGSTLPDTWRIQYIVCASFLALLSLSQALFRALSRRIACALARAALVTVLLVPATTGEPFAGLFATILVLECFLDLGSAFGLAFTIYFILVGSAFVAHPILLWDSEGPAAEPSFSLASLAQLLIGATAGYMLSLWRGRVENQALLIGDLRATNVRLTDSNIRFQDLAAEIEEATAEAERTRIAREIHDSLGFTLTNVLALLNAYRERMSSDREPVDEKINQARELIRDGLVDLRKVLKTLRTDTAKDDGGWDAIVKLVKVFRLASGIDVSLSFVNVPSRIGAAISDVFYHVMQEGLTNAFRHGKASRIEVIFCMSGKWIELTVRDDGTGAEDVKGGFGLVGIEERVSALGGRLEISTSPAAGFALSIVVPPPEEGDAE